MDMGLILKAGSVWNTLSKTELSKLDPSGVKALFKQFDHELPEEQANAISALTAGADPHMVVTDFIMNGHLTNAMMAIRQGAVQSSTEASLTRCPFCDNLHSA